MLNREGKMKTLLNIFGSMFIFLGLVSAAGMAGDCDGKCMELANPVWLMLLIGFGSVAALGLGAIMINQAGRIQ